MAGRRNAARSRLQPADSTEVCGNSNGTSAVTANATGRHAGGNGRGFSTARTARSSVNIPCAVGAPIKKIVCFPRH